MIAGARHAVMSTSAQTREGVLHLGPLAVVHDSAVGVAREEAVTCVLEGRLHQGTRLASEFDVEAGTDAEVLARAYESLGNEMLERLRGNFAFVIWDERRNRGALVSDQLTTRSLFIAERDDQLAFGTELRPLLGVLPREPAPDRASVAYWLASRTTVGERTLFDGVTRLGPGRFMEISASGWRKGVYWAPHPEKTLEGERQELAAAFREEVGAAISRQVKGTPGVFLSGGLDSSIVTTLAAGLQSSPADLHTYSAVFPEQPDYDESERIVALTDSLGVTGHRFTFEQRGALAVALEYQRDWDAPLMGVGALLENQLVRRAAADGIGTMLDGQAGDELFGQASYLIADRLISGRLLSALRIARRIPGLGEDPRREDVAWGIRLGIKGMPSYRMTELVRRIRGRERYAPFWLTPESRTLYAEIDDPWAWKRDGRPRWWAELKQSLVDTPQDEGRMDYFRRRGETVGVPTVSPLYDVDLIEFALRLPPEEAFDPMMSRTLIRDAMKGLMPEPVRLQNVKANFTDYYYGMLVGGDFPILRELLSDPAAEVLAYVDGEWLRNQLDRRPKAWQGRSLLGATLWGILVMECWLRGRGDSSFAEGLLVHPRLEFPACKPV